LLQFAVGLIDPEEAWKMCGIVDERGSRRMA